MQSRGAAKSDSKKGQMVRESQGNLCYQVDFIKNSLPVGLTFCNFSCVIYWPSTKPSIKRCTCVNKRKNSGSRRALENNITRCPGGLSQLETGCWNENQLQTEGFGSLVTPSWATQAKIVTSFTNMLAVSTSVLLQANSLL